MSISKIALHNPGLSQGAPFSILGTHAEIQPSKSHVFRGRLGGLMDEEVWKTGNRP